MNWRKGFFRVWVIITILWFLVILPPRWQALFVSGPEGEMEFYKRNAEVLPAPPAAREKGPDGKDVITPEYLDWFIQIGEKQKESGVVQVPLWSDRIFAAIFFLIPPLALLLAGLAIGWAVSGFRAKDA